MKAAVLVLADTETHEDRGRTRNALETAKEFKDAGDDVKLIFDVLEQNGFQKSQSQTISIMNSTRG